MFRFYVKNNHIWLAVFCVLTMGIISSATLTVKAQQDLNGRELLAVTRVAQGGEEYGDCSF